MIVSAAAGMLALGAFGDWAGRTAPDFFSSILAFPGDPIRVEPIGTARALGAAIGLVLGGMVGVVVLLTEAFRSWARLRRTELELFSEG